MERLNDQFKDLPRVTVDAHRPGATVTKDVTQEARRKYLGEEIVHYGIVCFMLLTGWWLAITMATDTLSVVGQMFGFTVTTWLVIVVYKGLKDGKYVGEQRKSARLVYQLLMVDEGFTILAKYYEPIRPYYLMWMAISIPILAYTAFHLIMMDEEMELDITKAENKVREKIQRELRASTQKLLEIDKEIAVVQAGRNLHDLHRNALLAESRNRASLQDARHSARNMMGAVYEVAGLKDGTGERKQLGTGKKGKKRPWWYLLSAPSSDGAGVKADAVEVKPSKQGGDPSFN